MDAHAELAALLDEPGTPTVSRALAVALVAEHAEAARTRTLGGPVTGRRVPTTVGFENLSHPPLAVRPDGSTEAGR